MGDIADRFATAFRDFAVDGLPASGAHDPDKADIRSLGPLIEQALGGAVAGLRFYATRSAMNADTTRPFGTLAYVYDDPTASNNTIYHYTAGGWVVDTTYYQGVAAVVGPQIEALRVSLASRGTSIFTPATRAANVSSSAFATYYDRFYGLEIVVPVDLSGTASPRIYATRIGVRSSDAADANRVGVTFSLLKTDGTFEAIAEAYNWGPAFSYPDGATFVDGPITGVGQYAGRITGKIRMERTTAWNYFFANGNNTNQIARAYSAGAASADDFEVDPAFVRRSDGGSLQPTYSIFTPTAFAQNKSDPLFASRIDTLYDLEIELSQGLDAKQYKRLFVTAISTEDIGIKSPTVEISYLSPTNVMTLIATGRASTNSVTTGQYDGGNTFVEYELTPAPGFGGLITGRFRWLRVQGWNYFFNGGTPITWSRNSAALGAAEISQNFITYIAGDGALVYPDAPTYSRLWERLPKFAERYLKGDNDVTMVVLGDSINTANSYASNRTDAALRPPLCHQNTLFSFVEERLRWRGQQYRRFDAPGVFTENASTRETKNYDEAWDWQAGTALVPNIQANFKDAATRVLTDGPASVSYAYPAGMRRCDFIYRTDYKCAALTTIAISGGNGRVQAYDEASQAWVEANGYSFSMKETDTVLSYSIVDPYGNNPNQPLRKSVYQRRLKMRSLSDLNLKTITLTNGGTGRLNYWGIEYSPRPTMFRMINSSRGGHNISRLRAFEAWDVDLWAPDFIWFNNNIINEGARSSLNMPATNRPQDFAGRFTAYAAVLRGKSFAPDLLTSTIFIGSGAQIVNQDTGAFSEGTVTGYGPANVFDYVGYLDWAYEVADVPHINMFYEFLDVAERKAAIAGTGNIWTAALQGSSSTGATLTIDGTHLNDYGNDIARRLLLPAFKRLY